MQQLDQTSSLTPVKLDLSGIQIKLSRVNALASLAISNYQKASEAQRREWANRFWDKPTTLKDQCLQQLAMKVLEAGKHIDEDDSFNDDLVSVLNDKLVEAYTVMISLRLKPLIDFKVHDELRFTPAQMVYQNVNHNYLTHFADLNNRMSAIGSKHLFNDFYQNVKFNEYKFKPSAKSSSPPDVIIPGKEEYESDVQNVRKYVGCLKELGDNPASFFNRLPKKLLVDIASRTRNSRYLTAEEAKAIAREGISNQNVTSIVIRRP